MDYFVRRPEKKWTIEPEETLLDRESVEMREHARMETPLKKRDFAALLLVMVLAGSVFAGRVVFLQTIKSSAYRVRAEANKTRKYPLLARRGIIYDRYETPLVENVPSFDAVAIPADLPRDKAARARMAEALEYFLGMESGKLAVQFGRMHLAEINPVVVKENIARETALALEARLADFPGIELKKNAMRRYPDGALVSHVLGYVGRVSENDAAQNPDFSFLDSIGKSGIELFYDNKIRGTNGVFMREVDAASRIKKETQVRSDAAGSRVVLTIDAPLQKKVTEALTRAMAETPSATGAAAVALSPSTGEVLALVSIPSYDGNMFSDAESRKNYARAEQDPAQPFFNRAASGLYPPGSSIKPFLALAALEENIVSPETKIMSTGAIVVRSPYNPHTSSVFRDWKEGGHGLVNVTRAIAESVNTYFFTIGGGYGGIDGLGIGRIKEYLLRFGFGAKADIDIPGESAGVVPDAQWKEKVLKEKWMLGDTYNTSIGQGNLLASPLQVARAYAFLANGGTLVRPFLLKSVTDNDKKIVFENKGEVEKVPGISEKNIQVIRRALRETVTNGTARRLADLPVAVAGKTGTAQFGAGKAHAWFASFAPFDNPRIVLVVLVEGGGEGSAVAVPATREIYSWYFSRQ